MQNYFTPQILVAPTEPSGFVAVKDDFNWSLYDPLADIYWDADEDGNAPPDAETYIPFAVRLNTGADRICNTSYAHTPICGDRKVSEWRDSLNSKWAVIGNRGPQCGQETEDIYYGSVTLEFHGGRKQWVGNIGYNDNHVELHDTFYPDGGELPRQQQRDLAGQPVPERHQRFRWRHDLRSGRRVRRLADPDQRHRRWRVMRRDE
jgi:hypothetical protein